MTITIKAVRFSKVYRTGEVFQDGTDWGQWTRGEFTYDPTTRTVELAHGLWTGWHLDSTEAKASGGRVLGRYEDTVNEHVIEFGW